MRMKIQIKRMIPVVMSVFLLVAFSAPAAIAQDNGIESLRQTGQAFRSVANKVSPAVVFIKVEKEVTANAGSEFFSPFNDDFFRRFFGAPQQDNRPRQQQPPKKRYQKGQGSGFLISADGYIMTNNHVVGEADTVQVQLLDGREYKAELIGNDPGSDLAVIKIDENDLPFLQLGNSDRLEVGDWVLAFGNPFGLSHTLTAGIVSAKGRSAIGLNDYEDYIQTDAAINPGNSGGPLVNLDGEVVGINSAIYSRSGGYMGIGFAIPVNMAQQIKDQLIEHGEVQRGRLGVAIQDLTSDLAESFDLKDSSGALITQVMEDSPAEKSGLKQGDIIIQLNGEKIKDVASLRNQVAMTAPGTKIDLTILRDGKKKTVRPVIGKRDKDQLSSAAEPASTKESGMSLQPLTPDLATQLGYDSEQKGVLIAAVEGGSAADRAGLERGVLIVEIDRTAVSDVKQAKKLLQTEKKVHLLLIQKGEALQYVALKATD